MDRLPDANGYTNIEERNIILLFNGLCRLSNICKALSCYANINARQPEKKKKARVIMPLPLTCSYFKRDLDFREFTLCQFLVTFLLPKL